MIELSIIVVNYNAGDFISSLIKGLKDDYPEVKSGDYEIIVVDNHSTDSSLNDLEKDKDIKLIKNSENLGFSKANNIAINRSQGKYLLFLNPDTKVNKGTIYGMLGFMESHSEAGASTCQVLLQNGKIDDASHRGFPTPWNSLTFFMGLSKLFPKSRLFSGYNLGWLDISSEHEIEALAGSFMLVRRKAGEDVGWWDEDFFFYGEDIDFCYRLKQKGWKIYFVPQFNILHYKGLSSGIKKSTSNITTASDQTRNRATEERFRAMRLFYDKHYKNKYPRIVTLLVKLGIGLKQNLS